MPAAPKPRVKKQKPRFGHRRDKGYAKRVRVMTCFTHQRRFADPTLFQRILARFPAFPSCSGPDCVMHIKGRGVGGDDRGNILPSCWQHNDWQTTHMTAIQYGELLECDAVEEAAVLWRRYLAETSA